MDVKRLKINICEAIVICKSPLDAVKHLLIMYASHRFLMILAKISFTITYEFSDYVKSITLILRNNLGSDVFIFSEVFCRKYYDFYLPFTPSTILDLGGNIGLSSIFFRKKYPNCSIATMEPMEGNLDILRKNMENNNSNVTILPFAVAKEDGAVDMCVRDLDYDHHILVDGEAYGKTITVEAKCISTILSILGWDRISLLKMDIEGYESILLHDKTDWLALVDAFCIEIHGDYCERDLINLASVNGFDSPSKIPGGLWLLIRSRTREISEGTI